MIFREPNPVPDTEPNPAFLRGLTLQFGQFLPKRYRNTIDNVEHSILSKKTYFIKRNF